MLKAGDKVEIKCGAAHQSGIGTACSTINAVNTRVDMGDGEGGLCNCHTLECLTLVEDQEFKEGDKVTIDCDGSCMANHVKGEGVISYVSSRKPPSKIDLGDNGYYNCNHHKARCLTLEEVTFKLHDEVIKSTPEKEQYTFKLSHKAALDVNKVELTNEAPYALITVDNDTNVAFLITPHLHIKSRTLRLNLGTYFSQVASGNYAAIVEASRVAEVLECLKEVAKASWNTDVVTATVTVYKG